MQKPARHPTDGAMVAKHSLYCICLDFLFTNKMMNAWLWIKWIYNTLNLAYYDNNWLITWDDRGKPFERKGNHNIPNKSLIFSFSLKPCKTCQVSFEISFRILHVITLHSSSRANVMFEFNQKWVTYTQKQEAKKILEMASSTVKKDKKLILTKTIIVNIVLSDGKNKKESTTINCKCIGAKMESKPSK